MQRHASANLVGHGPVVVATLIKEKQITHPGTSRHRRSGRPKSRMRTALFYEREYIGPALDRAEPAFQTVFEMITTSVAPLPFPSVANSSVPTRERLLEVAERRFAEHGYTDTSVRDITAGAGCNLASVNYHFGGKEQLYLEIFRRRPARVREERLASLREIRCEAEDGACLETLLHSFVLAFLAPFKAPGEGQLWVQLMWRELSEPHL